LYMQMFLYKLCMYCLCIFQHKLCVTNCFYFSQLLFVYRMINYSPPAYDNGTPYPDFAQALGWVVLTIALCPVPLGFMWRLLKGIQNPAVTNAKEMCHFLFSPTPQWRPNDKAERTILPEGAANGQDFHMDKQNGINGGYDNLGLDLEKA
ncbi:unnamed protein product, partial [Candidula unifasciata]